MTGLSNYSISNLLIRATGLQFETPEYASDDIVISAFVQWLMPGVVWLLILATQHKITVGAVLLATTQ